MYKAQRGAPCLAQGHFSMWSVDARDQATDLPTGRRLIMQLGDIVIVYLSSKCSKHSGNSAWYYMVDLIIESTFKYESSVSYSYLEKETVGVILY